MKHAPIFTAVLPKPSGREIEVRFEQLLKQFVRLSIASMSTTNVFGTTMLVDYLSYANTALGLVGTGSVDICSTSAGMSVSFVPSGTATPFAAIAVFSAACAFLTF